MSTGSINISSNISRSEVILQNYPPAPATEFRSKVGNTKVSLFWTDPDYSYTTTDGHTVEWAYTRIVRKTGGYPVNETDGTIVTESSVKNQYKTDPYIDTNLINDTTYYYAAFTCSKEGVFNREVVTTRITPLNYRIMTVKINLNNSNPSTCGSYADDASTMSSGKDVAAWQEFFGYRPCLFKDGKVVGYLDPTNFTKFEDGSDADITSGDVGDVMIQFPRRGVRISKSEKVVSVSMTDNPNDSSFKYYAHQRGSINKDYFYLGVYAGWVSGNKLRSLSGKSPTVSKSLNKFYTYGKANGSGYGCMGYYQWLFLQVMYVLQFKGNLNSQNTVGYGNCDSGYIQNTGRSNTNGMIYGDSNVAKLFGIEDIWGNIYQLVNNYYSNSNYHVTTTTDDTVIDVNKYTDRGSYGGSSPTVLKFYTDCMGTTEAGFTLTYNSTNGSSTTYFCDHTNFYSNRIPNVGGYVNGGDVVGLFYFNVDWNRDNDDSSTTGSRLQYL